MNASTEARSLGFEMIDAAEFQVGSGQIVAREQICVDEEIHPQCIIADCKMPQQPAGQVTMACSSPKCRVMAAELTGNRLVVGHSSLQNHAQVKEGKHAAVPAKCPKELRKPPTLYNKMFKPTIMVLVGSLLIYYLRSPPPTPGMHTVLPWTKAQQVLNNISIAQMAGDAQSVLAEMETHLGSELIQVEGFDALATLAHSDIEYQNEIPQGSGAKLLLLAMTEHKDTPTVQAQGCKAIQRIVNSHTRNVADFGAAGAVAVIARSMRAHTDSEAVLSWGCAALTSLANKNTTNVVTVTSLGMIVDIIEMMGRHAASQSVQANCCALLRNLAAADSAESNADDEITAAGGIEEILSGMDRFSTPKVHIVALAALRSLSKNRKQRGTLVSAGAIEAVVDSMVRFEATLAVQEYGCQFLRALAVESETRPRIQSAGGARAIEKAMRNHATSSSEIRTCGRKVLGEAEDGEEPDGLSRIINVLGLLLSFLALVHRLLN